MLALPTGCQQGALLPIMDVNRLFVEILVVVSAEIARFLVQLLLIGKLLSARRVIAYLIILLSSSTVCWLSLHLRLRLLRSIIALIQGSFSTTSNAFVAAWTSFSTPRVDVGRNNFLSLRSRNHLRNVPTSLSKKSLNLIDLSLTKTLECASDLITKHLVELDNATLRWLSHVLEGVCQALGTEVQAHVQLIFRYVHYLCQDSGECLITTNDQFV